MSRHDHDTTTDDVFLSPRQLSRRHGCSEKKLANDRLAGRGIPFSKLGRLVRYHLAEVLRYEREAHRHSTSDRGGHDA